MIKSLAKHEQQRLFFEAVITAGAMLLIYFGCVFIASKLLSSPVSNELTLRDVFGLTDRLIRQVSLLFTIVMFVLSLWFIRWRLARRYRHYELQHLLQELDYIAQGHYEHRISEEMVGRLGNVAISINKLVDSTLKAREEERLIEQTKQELITNVSHDIRTPLTSVIGYLGLIEEKQYHSIEELEHYVHIAYTKSQQMKKLSDDLFAYIRVHDYQEQLQLQQISVFNFLMQIAAEYEMEAQKVGIQIRVDAPRDLIYAIDAEKMARVYDNLMSNAFKYSLATQLVLQAKQAQDKVILLVKNNGKPIRKQALEQLFTRFYRVEQSRSKQTGGTGLGLAIVESIVQQHKGEVSVYSNAKWTVFKIVLPNLTTLTLEKVVTDDD